MSAVPAHERHGYDKADDENEKVKVGEDLPCGDVGGASTGKAPKQEQGEDERDGEGKRNTVAGQVMWRMVRRVTRRVSDKRGDIDAYQGEVVKVQAPCPYACETASARTFLLRRT